VSSAHTLGPWSVGGPTDCLNQVAIEPCIGVAYGAGHELAANARLIAAAPELLAVLRRMVDAVEADDQLSLGTLVTVQAALAAIGNATGDAA
jgi:hypothetical protein